MLDAAVARAPFLNKEGRELQLIWQKLEITTQAASSGVVPKGFLIRNPEHEQTNVVHDLPKSGD